MAQIEHYRFGRIVIDGQAYDRDLILLPDRIVTDWWRESGHVLHVADLQEVLEARPEVLIVGCGTFGRLQVPDGVRKALGEVGIELVALPTRKACEAYARLSQERSAAAALHLAC